MLSVEVSELLKDQDSHLELKLLAGKKGLTKKINIPRIQKPGLALIGDTSRLHPGRIQVLGKSEITFLKSLNEDKMTEVIAKICKAQVSCFVITRDNAPPKILTQQASRYSIPLFKTPLITSTFINRVTRFLEEYLTATVSVHGVFVDVFGVGMLLLGKSGIGKSELALDLVSRGHRLVADDMVEIRKRPPGTLIGFPTDLLKHHMEIRGLGILNIKDLFGVGAVRTKKIVDIVVELVEWNPNYEYDRLGIDEHKYTILEIPLPYLKVPVSPGRNVTTILEVTARNALLKSEGLFASKIFEERLNRELVKNAKHPEDGEEEA